MRKTGLAFLLTCAFIAWPIASLAQKHPNIELGFNPDRLYQFTGLDSVNLFNGNLIVQIPIGQTYTVNALKYQLTLVYNGKMWDYEKFTPSPTQAEPNPREYTYAFPNWRSNAGVGWRLSFGRLIAPGDGLSWWNDEIFWKYEDASGSEHPFGKADRSTGTTNFDNDQVLLSRDQSAIRMVRQADGARHLEFPNGEVHRFEFVRGRWRLRKISDRFGNYLQFGHIWKNAANESDGREAEWLLSDSEGRNHRVTFDYFADTSDSFDGGQHVRSVVLDTAANTPSQTSTYTFDVQPRTVAWGCGNDPELVPPPPANANLPLLESLTLPDGSTFQFQYYKTANVETCSQGALESMTLPTKGEVRYDYQRVPLPESFCWPSKFGALNPGVKKKTVTSDSTPAVTDYIYSRAVEAAYDRAAACQDCGCYTPVPEAPPPPEPQQLFRWSRTSVLSPAVGGVRARNDSYFYTWNTELVNDAFNPSLVSGGTEKRIRFAQPITPRAPSDADAGKATVADADASTVFSGTDTHYLSTRLFEKCPNAVALDCTSGRLLRSTHLKFPDFAGAYSGESLMDTLWFYPEESTITKYHDDNLTDGDSAWGCGGVCQVQTKNSESDGLHKYRKSTTTTNFPDGGGSTTHTNYRPWTLTMVGQLASGSPAHEWLLNLYDYTERTEGTVTAKTEYCFDAVGFLTGVRNRSSATARQKSDILTRFSGTKGNVEREESYGARENDVSIDTACPSTAMKLQYLTQNSFSNGVFVKSEACVPGTECSSVVTTQHIDAHRTGAPTVSYDAAGVKTFYDYDEMGRLWKVRPTGSASATYAYALATASSPAKVTETVTDSGNATLTETAYEFDGLGRLLRVTKSLPESKKASVETKYDALGRKSEVTQPFDPDVSGTKPATVTRYDALGRPVQITAPDGKVLAFDYAGDHLLRRTTKEVATSVSGTTDAKVTEHFDAQRRLKQVIEYSQNTSVTAPEGGRVQTLYQYDVAGRLTNVETVGGATQEPRTFDYDLRGFLTQEKHPENGTTTYDRHDARGHAETKTSGGVTLKFSYDPAERVITVEEGGTILKQFSFSTANAGSNLLKGKLKTAVRRNVLPSAGVVEVTETYSYETATGQMSKRVTLVEQVSGAVRAKIQEFEYSATYDALRLPETVTIPTCSLHGCSTPAGLGTITNQRSAGYLTSVTGFASLTYHPSGMVRNVSHADGGEDKYDAESGLGRPSTIALAGTSSCPAPTIQTADPVCAGTAGTASVTAVTGVSYSWTIQGGSITSGANSSAVTFQSTGSSSVTLTVTASSGCGTRSSTKTVAVSSAPAASTITAPSAVCASTAGHSASVPFRSGISHTWQISGGTITSATAGDSITFNGHPGSTAVTLTVTATASGSCAGNTSSSKQVQITTRPTAELSADGFPSGEVKVVRGTNTTVQLRVSLTGAGPWEIEWNDRVEMVTTNPHIRPITPTTHSEYTILSAKSAACQSEPTDISGIISVRIVPPPPQWVTAATQPDGSIRISWEDVPGAAGYRIERRTSISSPTPSWSTDVMGASSFIHTLPSTAGPVTYIYSVRTIDPYPGEMSAAGAFDYVTGGATLWSQAIVLNESYVRGQDIQEMRKAIDAVRVAFGSGPAFSGSTSPSGAISAAHLKSLISALDGGRVGRYPPFAYQNVPPPSTGGSILGEHIQQLRNAVD